MFGIIYAFSDLIKFFVGGKNKKKLSLLIDAKYKGSLVTVRPWADIGVDYEVMVGCLNR